jgi:DNA polymerase
MPFALLYFGAHTGRWSGTAKVNFQNMRKVPIFCGQDGLMEMDDAKALAATEYFDENKKWPEWVKHAIDFRALILPRPGMKMISSDLSQIEPRVLAWMTGNTALLDQLRGGSKLYDAHARATMGWVGTDLKKEDKGKYGLSKARVLGLGYGAGWEKFITMAKSLAQLDITTEDPEFEEVALPNGLTKTVSGYGKRSREIVAQFRADNQDVVAMWRGLDAAMKRSVREDFVVELPSGRKLRYEFVRCERRTVPDPETGKPVSREVFTVGIGGRRFVTYGGKLTENVVQAASRDVFGEMLVNMDKAGMTNMFSCHDEAVLEVNQGVKASDVREIMSVTPDWMPGLPLDAETKECDRYCK